MKKIKNELKKLYLKIFNKPKYFDFRTTLREEKKRKRLTPDFTNKIKSITEKINSKDTLNFKHSGHLGDLLYALPVIKELSKTKTCNLYIQLNADYDGYYHKHPSGGKMISERSYQMLLPLLKEQDYISDISILEQQEIDVDLDVFREMPCSLQFHSVRWYFQITGIQSDLNLPYLDVKPHNTIRNKIVIVRTFRAKNPYLDYSFLKDHDNLLFLGTKNEYQELQKTLPNLEFYDTKDFLELAQIIKASKFYISNQTFAYAVAEGLKVNRILEANPDFPVIFPIGGNGHDVYFQHHFEALFKKYNLVL